MKLFICILITIVLLSLILYVTTKYYSNSKCYVDNFMYEPPRKMFNNIVYEFDKPQIIINQPNGFAIWFPSKIFEDTIYDTIMIKDEQVLNNVPITHYDFLYTTIKLKIPIVRIPDVLAINPSILYDKETYDLTVRGNSMANNRSLFYSILKLLTDPSVFSPILAQKLYIKTLDEIDNNQSKQETIDININKMIVMLVK